MRRRPGAGPACRTALGALDSRRQWVLILPARHPPGFGRLPPGFRAIPDHDLPKNPIWLILPLRPCAPHRGRARAGDRPAPAAAAARADGPRQVRGAGAARQHPAVLAQERARPRARRLPLVHRRGHDRSATTCRTARCSRAGSSGRSPPPTAPTATRSTSRWRAGPTATSWTGSSTSNTAAFSGRSGRTASPPTRTSRSTGRSSASTASAEYYRATGDIAALEQAVAIYGLIEKNAHDPVNGGYFDALSREWQRAGAKGGNLLGTRPSRRTPTSTSSRASPTCCASGPTRACAGASASSSS